MLNDIFAVTLFQHLEEELEKPGEGHAEDAPDLGEICKIAGLLAESGYKGGALLAKAAELWRRDPIAPEAFAFEASISIDALEKRANLAAARWIEDIQRDQGRRLN